MTHRQAKFLGPYSCQPLHPVSLRKGQKPKWTCSIPINKLLPGRAPCHLPAPLLGRAAPPMCPQAIITHKSPNQTHRSLPQPPRPDNASSTAVSVSGLIPFLFNLSPHYQVSDPGQVHLTFLCLSFPICKRGIMTGLSCRVIMRSK